LLIAIIIAAPVLSLCRTHFVGNWFGQCVAQQHELLKKNAISPVKNAKADLSETSPETAIAEKSNCMLVETGLAAGVAVGAFALVMFLWWLVSDLHGLRQICESHWSGLDDCDVESVGPLTSVVYAAIFIATVLALLGLLSLSVAGDFDVANLPLALTSPLEEPGDKPPSKPPEEQPGPRIPAIPGNGTSPGRNLVDAINVQTRVQQRTVEQASSKIQTVLSNTANAISSGLSGVQTQLGENGKRLDALDALRGSVERTEQELRETKVAVLDLAKAKDHQGETGDSAAMLKLAAEHLALLETSLDRVSAAIPEALNGTAKTLSTGLAGVRTQLSENGKRLDVLDALRRSAEQTEQELRDTKGALLDLAKMKDRPSETSDSAAALIKLEAENLVRLEKAVDRLSTANPERTGTDSAAALQGLHAQLSQHQTDDAKHLAEFGNTLDRLSTASEGLKSVEAALTEHLGTLAKSIAALQPRTTPPPSPAPPSPTGPCLPPQFKIDPEQKVQSLQLQSVTDRQSAGLPNTGTFREIAEHVFFFDNAASRLSRTGEARLIGFLASHVSEKTALSVRGSADGRGDPKKNEHLSRERAIETATVILGSKRFPPIVDLDWSVTATPEQSQGGADPDPYRRTVTVRVLQLCQ
jgi:hypothetical protein